MTRRTALTFALLGLALLVVAAPQALADDKIDVTGTWEVEIEIGGQTGMPTFTFKQDGEKLTGKYKGQFGEEDVKGTLKGKDIEFSFEAQGNKIAYKGTVDKDTMKGTADYAGQATGDWKAKKKADK